MSIRMEKMGPEPGKNEIEAIFSRLRSIPANKLCFDCGARGPTWSSITYGVFICIDCAAVHRGLGVHLTFVRSTKLDTNWTWLQLREMELGGNANAIKFFTQHNCMTTDAQKKYNSRAARMYSEKLLQLAQNSLKSNSELDITPHVVEEIHNTPQDVDFFSEHENFETPDIAEEKLRTADNQPVRNDDEGPKIDFTRVSDNAIKSTITTRKTAVKKSGLGVKKGGLGATKVKTNFAELEREAQIAEETKQNALENLTKTSAQTLQDLQERLAARLAYKDLADAQLTKEEVLKKQDPRKAEQVERLGMGVSTRKGISHSAVSDMQVIEQENVQATPSTLSSLGKLRISDNNDSFFDDFSFNSGFNMNRNSYSTKLDSFLAESNSGGRDSWVVIDDPIEKSSSKTTSYGKDKPTMRNIDRTTVASSSSTTTITSNIDEAQKKFGNAKAISSEQYFNDRSSDCETKANLNRFHGSSSISSAEFFGNGKDITPSNNSPLQNYDLDDVKESVRQGVTKVAGKLSSLANGVMSSLQDRYGY